MGIPDRAGTDRLSALRGALAGLLFATLASPALATPVTVWMDGVAGYGFEAASVTAAQAAGASVRTPGPGWTAFTDDYVPPGGPLFEWMTLNNPIDPATIPSSPDRSDPVTADAIFSVTALTQDYQNLHVVLIGHSPIDPTGAFYADENVGLEIDPMTEGWSLYQPDPTAFPDVYYLMIRIGDLAQNESAALDVDYRVAQALFLSSPGPPQPRYDLPQLWVGYLELPVPEPVGLVGVACAISILFARRSKSVRA